MEKKKENLKCVSLLSYRALKNATAKNQQAQHQLEEQRKKEEVIYRRIEIYVN